MKRLITRMRMAGLLLVALACNRLDVDEVPDPQVRLLREAPAIVLVLDTLSLRAQLQLDTAILRSKPWEATSAGFGRGMLRVAEKDGHIQAEYAPKGTLYIGSDTGSLRLCQSGQCRTAQIIVQVPRFRGAIDPADTVTPPRPVTCTDLPSSVPVYIAEGGNQNLDGLDGLAAGAKIDSAWVTNFRVQIRQDSLSLAYAATGNTEPLGFDDVYYRVRLPNGDCVTGHIPIIVGDTCEVRAHNDRLPGLSSGSEVEPETLLANDQDCFGFGASDPRVRLKPQDYTPPFRVEVPGGSLTDTVLTSPTRRVLYFRRAVGSTATPVFTYYLLPDVFSLWSRATLTIP